MKKIIFLMIFTTLISGCAQIKDKFTPKKEEKEGPLYQKYIQVREYNVKPSIELYTKRYVFWKNWQRELISVLDHQNRKKKIVAAEQIVSNLLDMRRMLMDNKGEAIEPYIREMMDIENILKTENITIGNETRVRRRIEKVERYVKRYFNYNDMEPYIRDEFGSYELTGEK